MGERLGFVLRGDEASVAEVGGKAAALDRLIALGARVPSCGVLTTDAYRSFVQMPGLVSALSSLRSAPLPTLSACNDERRRVDDLFLDAPMPEPVAAAIRALAASVDGDGSLAVRSSATAEDLGSCSFAGQYRSLIDVDRSDLERAVRLVWASLWHPAPRAYRRFHQIDEDRLAMAVLVMRLIEPRMAGVAFTREPGSASDRIRIELVRGFGERLVSGAETPQVLVVPRSGTQAELAALSPALAGLPDLAVGIETDAGAAQDIEWAVDGEGLWILQARPITALDPDGSDDGFDVHATDADDWTTAGIAEMLPGLLPPRLWELDSWLVEESFRALFERLGGDIGSLAAPHALLARFRGRAALNMDAVRGVVRTIPGGSVAELEHQYFGRIDSPAPASGGTSGFRQNVRLLRVRASAMQESETVTSAVDLLLDQEPDLGALDDEQLLAFAARVRDFGVRAMTSEVEIAALAAAAFRGVEAVLSRHLDPVEATRLAQEATGQRRLVGNALTAALAPMAASTWTAEGPGPDGNVQQAQWYRDAVRRAGSRSVFGGPTWEEDPALAAATWRAIGGRAPVGAGDELAVDDALVRAADRVHRDPAWRVIRASAGLVADTRRAFLRREADDAAELLARRERSKAAVMMLGGVARRADREIARRLRDRGRVTSVDDIDVLSIDESEQMLRHDGPACVSPAHIASRRRRLRSAELSGPLPRRFRGHSPPLAKLAGAAIGHGWAASPGRYEGIGRVVDTPVRPGAFRRGDVLVARTTDSSWVPLFLLAGAIVVEDGGPLSHAAIIARELGIPTIVNVPGIVDRVAQLDDPILTVDGTTGDLAVHEHHPDRRGEAAAGVVAVRTPPAEPAVGLHVFVTGLIGAGALLSIVASLTERLGGARARARLRRRSEPAARSIAVAVATGFPAAGVDEHTVGRSRRWLGSVGAALLAAAASFVARAAADAPTDATQATAVLGWAATCTTALWLGIAGAMSIRSAITWPRVDPATRRAMLALPVRRSSALAARYRSIAVVSSLLVALLAASIATPIGLVERFDRWSYSRLGAGESADRILPAVTNYFGRPIVAIALAVVLALAARRCAVLAVAIPASVVVTGVTVFGLTWLTARERPSLGAHAGEYNSFPGGHAAQETLLLGLVLLVAATLLDRAWLRALIRAVAPLLYLAVIVDVVRTGGHWPTDQLGGVLIGVAAWSTVAARIGEIGTHAGCGQRCPIARRTP